MRFFQKFCFTCFYTKIPIMKDLLLIFLSLEENLPFSNDMYDLFPINSYSSQIFPYLYPYRLPRKNMNSEMFQYNRPTWYAHFRCSSMYLHVKKPLGQTFVVYNWEVLAHYGLKNQIKKNFKSSYIILLDNMC